MSRVRSCSRGGACVTSAWAASCCIRNSLWRRHVRFSDPHDQSFQATGDLQTPCGCWRPARARLSASLGRFKIWPPTRESGPRAAAGADPGGCDPGRRLAAVPGPGGHRVGWHAGPARPVVCHLESRLAGRFARPRFLQSHPRGRANFRHQLHRLWPQQGRARDRLETEPPGCVSRSRDREDPLDPRLRQPGSGG